ncbi:hypothetical protein EQG49_09565 [Periweissella cryptocerci]|uniref:Uncharacterized protein n=1 Tax=Periweissella cryptocerci TaxID=2506420 RepID=A0A4P6YV52_9LACO|nr:hypothetical protein [Periweissella cryptocerci]QBO36689.1 hypothetical protein EQG49_09565 [Periweissella cryptocerci]
MKSINNGGSKTSGFGFESTNNFNILNEYEDNDMQNMQRTEVFEGKYGKQDMDKFMKTNPVEKILNMKPLPSEDKYQRMRVTFQMRSKK